MSKFDLPTGKELDGVLDLITNLENVTKHKEFMFTPVGRGRRILIKDFDPGNVGHLRRFHEEVVSSFRFCGKALNRLFWAASHLVSKGAVAVEDGEVKFKESPNENTN